MKKKTRAAASGRKTPQKRRLPGEKPRRAGRRAAGTAAPAASSDDAKSTIRRLKAQLAKAQARDRGTAGLRRYRLPARYSEPARLRARAAARDRLHQALSRQRRPDRARRRSPEADQRSPSAMPRATRCSRPSSRRCSGQVRASDVIGRLGGDEFALLLWNLSETDAKAKAASLEEAIDRLTFVFRGRTITAGASAGVAILDIHCGSRPRAGSGRQRDVCAQGAAAA